MKNIFSSFALLFIVSNATSQTYQWAKSIGSPSSDAGKSIAVDASGNVYITGYFGGTADFDPGAGTANLTAVGVADIFVAKYFATGSYQWARSIGSITGDKGYDIAIDDSGNIYTAGNYTGTADFDPGAGTANLTPVGYDDIFFAKYSSSGSYLWAKSIGSAGGDYGYSITVDDSANVYITGAFSDTADFDPGAGTANLFTMGDNDIFFAKYNSSGAYRWANSIGSSSYDNSYSIAVDDIGNVYITGEFTGIADFDPGTGTATLTSVGSYDIFFAKYNSLGDYQWANSIGTIYDDMGNSITVDDSSNVYIIGYFEGTADFDPDTGTSNRTPVGYEDIFFAKYNSLGGYLWANSIGSAYQDYGYDIDIDTSGNVYLTGFFEYTADFDPSPGTVNLTPVGYDDIFLAKYSQIITGIGELFADYSQLKAYPNPNNGKFIVEIPDAGFSKLGAEIKIYNILGKAIYLSTLTNNNHKITVDLSFTQPGIYYIQLSGDGILMNKKVIVE